MIATTIEQSKELLNAGLDPESADMRWEQLPGFVPHLCYQPDVMPLIAPKVTPAWSLSKLWDILHDSGQMFYEYPTTLSAVQVLDSLVEAVKRAVKTGRIK